MEPDLTAMDTAPDPKEEAAASADVPDQPIFEIKKWNAVALWSWDLVVDSCAICRSHIMSMCKLRLQSPENCSFAVVFVLGCGS